MFPENSDLNFKNRNEMVEQSALFCCLTSVLSGCICGVIREDVDSVILQILHCGEVPFLLCVHSERTEVMAKG